MLALRTLRSADLAGEAWGGLAAMLVALPSAIAFGVTIYSGLGASHASQGAVAGLIGAAALGLVAPLFGGAPRLITVPCAPAAAVLGALTLGWTADGIPPDTALLMLLLTGLLAGVMQLAFGALRLGQLIKYMPYPVVSGYLSGVGIIIIASQWPRYAGVSGSLPLWQTFTQPGLWDARSFAVGTVTVLAMVFAPRWTRKVPAAIVALAAGIATYFALALADPRLLSAEDNALLIGSVGGLDGGFVQATLERLSAGGNLDLSRLQAVLVPAATLAVLLSIDTLKTCVVLDALTRTRHDSNQELIAQGLANCASAASGGIAGAGAMGATLVNTASGGRTGVSGVIEGVLALLTFVLLAPLVAWVPVAALAGILIVVGVKMIDVHSLRLLRSRATVLDFAVIVAVILVAEFVSLIAASGTGVALAVLLFLRREIGGSVVRRKTTGAAMYSKQMRPREEMAVLERRGAQTTIVELQGSLFFGTAEQLYATLEADLKTQRYVILDFRRVQSVDVTAAHVLEQMQAALAERKALMIYSDLPRNVPSGENMRSYFDQVGLVQAESRSRVFGELDDALEWVEQQILEDERLARGEEQALELHEMALFRGRTAETLAALAACVDVRSYRAGELVCRRGDAGRELFLIRRGAVRIVLPLAEGEGHHLATFGRGDFFGEMAFFDREARSADAIAHTDAELYVLPRERFDVLAKEHHHLAFQLLDALGSALSSRLRYANAELRALEDN